MSTDTPGHVKAADHAGAAPFGAALAMVPARHSRDRALGVIAKACSRPPLRGYPAGKCWEGRKQLGLRFGSRWRHLGVILASSWRHLGAILASSWRHLGVILAPSWRHLAYPGPSWRHLGVVLAHLSVILASFWPILAHLGVILVSSWLILASSWFILAYLGKSWLTWAYFGQKSA